MDGNKKYLLEKVLDRIDFYTNTVNVKAGFIIAFNTFILGSVGFKYSTLINSFNCKNIKLIITFILLVIVFGVGMSIYKTFKAVYPFLDSGSEDSSYKSLLFFKSIDQMGEQNFFDKLEDLNDDILEKDFKKQTYILSHGLSEKFEYISKSMFWIVWFVLFPLGIIALLKITEFFYLGVS